jgi:hypothetical protein
VKKFLPLILIGSGILLLIIVIFVIKGTKGGNTPVQEEANVPEIPQDQRPTVSLTPSSDGHWLDFKVQGIKVKGAATMDYELLYTTGTGIQQGVPGTVKLDGGDIDRKLLLGSESSGKFRYDEGVKEGTMTVKFRNDKGKLLGKLSTTFSLNSPKKGVFEVTMDTFTDGTKIFSSE